MNAALHAVLNSNWAQHPTTREAIEKLREQSEQILAQAIAQSDVQQVTDISLRQSLVKVKALRSAITLLQQLANPTETNE